ncbi:MULTISPECIES: hypothetical protein [Kordiimonas]|jgi:hypothetical protein|uniref:hypothetical protein n=1 Tax=Kordiimonas TaxID=288021 RepID=UPI00257EC5DC|nr:hypothetical protein [Kordiimonas sp. UBA4487]
MADTEMIAEEPQDKTDTGLEKAWHRVKLASIAAMISATITTLVAVAGFFVDEPTGKLAYYLDPWLLIDAACLWVMAYFVRKGSFFTAVILVIYWILSMILAMIEVATGGLLINFLFLYYFVNGARGARIIRRSTPDKSRNVGLRILLWGAGSVVAIIFSFLLIVGLAMELGFAPDTEVQKGAAVPDRIVQTMRENGILTENETVEYFYSAGAFSALEDGNVITDQRVISYWQDDASELQINSTALSDIESVHIDEKGDALNDTIILVYDNEGYSFMLGITTENGGDRRFFERLNQIANQNKKGEGAS